MTEDRFDCTLPDDDFVRARFTEKQEYTVNIVGRAYLHVKYADKADPADGEMNDDGGDYMGVAVTVEEEAPESASAYKWTLIRGRTGMTGPAGPEGKRGEQGPQGETGERG